MIILKPCCWLTSYTWLLTPGNRNSSPNLKSSTVQSIVQNPPFFLLSHEFRLFLPLWFINDQYRCKCYISFRLKSKGYNSTMPYYIRMLMWLLTQSKVDWSELSANQLPPCAHRYAIPTVRYSLSNEPIMLTFSIFMHTDIMNMQVHSCGTPFSETRLCLLKVYNYFKKYTDINWNI